jgi:serine/threonine protein kinase
VGDARVPLIYIVEDSPAQRELLRAALAPLGHELRLFPDGRAAREALHKQAPDLLVADIVLPGLSGLELTQEARERHRRLELPVILVSSLDQMDDLARGYEAGADDYIVKPIDPTELRRKAQLMLDRRAQRTQPTTATRYQLLGPLGKGQMATIYRARRRDDGLVLALKTAPQGSPPDAVGRLLAEAELLRSLEDVPGVVRVRDVGLDGGATYYAMELVPGETLRARLDRAGRLPLVEVAQIGRALATTLVGLRRDDVVHGDLKPENILLSPAGPVLIDFGLARRQGEPAPPARGGTLTHLAPEVVRGAPATPASDVYALGVILFEALCGRLPYEVNGEALASLKVEGAPPDLEPLLGQDVPPGFVALIEEALAVDPAHRTHDADAVATALLPYAR